MLSIVGDAYKVGPMGWESIPQVDRYGL